MAEPNVPDTAACCLFVMNLGSEETELQIKGGDFVMVTDKKNFGHGSGDKEPDIENMCGFRYN